jgi:hypothetical protein
MVYSEVLYGIIQTIHEPIEKGQTTTLSKSIIWIKKIVVQKLW